MNFKVLMGYYPMFLWERTSQYLEGLPEDKKTLAKVLQAEGSGSRS